MRCYIHSTSEAVGICRACGKGLCTDCAVDLGFGLSCRGEHEQRVAANDALISKSAQLQDTAGRAKYAAPVFFLFSGAVMGAYGLMNSKADMFLVLLGGGFLAFGAFLFVMNCKAYRIGSPMPNTSLERTRGR
jgi:hypothetical protein